MAAKTPPPPLTYAQAGVSIERGDESVRRIKDLVATTHGPGVLGGIGGFSAVFDPKLKPGEVLLSSTDGVGTKLLIAQELDKHDTIGIDLVAMCVNDITAQNAIPIFFLDYIAGAKIIPELMEQILTGMVAGCRSAGASLIGGEMAEMPGMYSPGHYDLAGFAVGKVSKKEVVTGKSIKAGHVVVGLLSDTHHSNGYSLTRAILKKKKLKLTKENPALGSTWGEALLAPTPVYHPARAAWQGLGVSGLANITGGGLPGNLERLLPPGIGLEINTNTWTVPPLFQELIRLGEIEKAEAFKTYHMGVGFCVLLPEKNAGTLQKKLKSRGFHSAVIGRAVAGKGVKLNA